MHSERYSVQLLSHIWLFAAPWTAACQASLFITNSRSLHKFMSITSGMPSNHLILCRPLLLPPSIFPNMCVFSNESALHIRWPKYWSFSFSISPSNEHPELLSFRMDWLDLLAVQGTLQSLFQHQSLKASIFRCSAFFIVQLSLAQQGNLWPKGNRREMLTAHWQILSGQLHPCCYLKTLGGRWSVSAQATKLLSSVLLEI